MPTVAPKPTAMPTTSPTPKPTSKPTAMPTAAPTPKPTDFPYTEIVRNRNFVKVKKWKFVAVSGADATADVGYDCETYNSNKGKCAMKFTPKNGLESKMLLKAKTKPLSGSVGDVFSLSYYIKGIDNEKKDIYAILKFLNGNREKVD